MDVEENTSAPVVVENSVAATPSKKSKKSTTSTPKSKTSKNGLTEGTNTTPASKNDTGGTPPAKKSGKKTEIKYTELIEQAIVTMKDRTGSSIAAIKKWIVDNHPEIDESKIKSKMSQMLKRAVSAGRLIKVKSSYKINPETKKKKKKQEAARKKREKERKKEKEAKAKEAKKEAMEAKKKLSKEQLAKIKAKEAEERKAKELRDKIKRRKFPMDDIKLREEDKALGVHVKLPAAPKMDLVFPDLPASNRSDTTHQGLMDHTMHIYHFFRGDVGWGLLPRQRAVVAPFTLQQWLECVQQVAKGWSKKSRMLPPLMTHLFVVTLQHVVPPMLETALSPESFADILVLYMDAMNEYYRSNRDQTTSTHLEKSDGIDAAFLFGATDEEMDADQLEKPHTPEHLYLGDGALSKAHKKLLTGTDPWNLNADELLVLLSALVDDVVASSTECGEEFDSRIDVVSDLLKVKRAADAKFRKLITARNKEIADEKKDRKSADGDGSKATRSNVKLTKISDAQLERARREQQKAHSAWDKACRSKRIRLEPIGLDRNFSEVYHSFNDPDQAFVVKRGNKVPSEVPFDFPEDCQIHRTTWHVVDKKSTMDKFVSSLDVRGKRELALHEALEPISKHIYDDVKEANAKKSKLKEKEELRKRLESARSKFENNRTSSRLVSQSEKELIDLENEILALEESIKTGQEKKVYDIEIETGVDMLRKFESEDQQTLGKRTSRRETKQQKEDLSQASVPKLKCSVLWPSGRIDGTGIVGLMVQKLLDLEKRVERLASWENDRGEWASRLESAVETWNESNPPILLEHEKAESQSSPNGSMKSTNAASPNKAYVKPGQIIGLIRQPTLQLEDRIFKITGLSVAIKDADMADDNMSTSSADEEQQMLNEWKKIVNRLTRLTAKDGKKIKQILLDAIAAARSAHNLDALNGLREALLEHRPEGASLCQKMALEVLERHGGYDDQFDDDEEEGDVNGDDEDKIAMISDDGDHLDDGNGKATEDISSSLSAEAVSLNSSLDGHEDFARDTWIYAVRQAKTLSKLAALIVAFTKKATDRIEKMELESKMLRQSIGAWSKGLSLGKTEAGNDDERTTEVWAHVKYTDEFVLAKCSDWPNWPARKCQPMDENLASSLESVGRALVSLVGESGSLRVVKTDDLLPFSEKLPEDTDLSMFSKEIKNQLDECMVTARRVIRGLEKRKNKKGKR